MEEDILLDETLDESSSSDKVEEEESEVLEDESEETEEEQNESIDENSIDYTYLLESIDEHLENIEASQVELSEQLQEVRDNTYRLYYFIGGLYVAFAIVLAIRFLKIFF